jgi:hypothetical protein
MSSFFSLKLLRLLLTVMVSVWMAGGCLFGCSTMTMGAEPGLAGRDGSPAIKAGESCHAARAHDCCASKKPKQQLAKRSNQQQLPALLAVPLGMKDCPLAVNATAATAKNGAHVPDPSRSSVASLPRFELRAEESNQIFLLALRPNRGPTYLRCCVFLI